jgi:hypothetical protein
MRSLTGLGRLWGVRATPPNKRMQLTKPAQTMELRS